MKLTVETRPGHIDKNVGEIITYFTDEGDIIFQIVETIQRELVGNLMKRMIDRMFYEMKAQIYKKYNI